MEDERNRLPASVIFFQTPQLWSVRNSALEKYSSLQE
jgi:hypothetical protein